MKPWIKWLIIIIVVITILAFVFWILAAMKMKQMYDQNAGTNMQGLGTMTI